MCLIVVVLTLCTLLYLVLLHPRPKMSFDPGMLHNNGHTAYGNGSAPGLRESGVVEKLLTSYGFIQCSERQARLFFHCSQYNGNLQELKIGGQPHQTPTQPIHLHTCGPLEALWSQRPADQMPFCTVSVLKFKHALFFS